MESDTGEGGRRGRGRKRGRGGRMERGRGKMTGGEGRGEGRGEGGRHTILIISLLHNGPKVDTCKGCGSVDTHTLN